MKAKKLVSGKRVRLDIRLSHEDKARIKAAAAATGKSVNAYATEWLVRQADDVINQYETKASDLCAF